MPSFTASETIPVVFLSGFAIQQMLTILDPFIIMGMRDARDNTASKQYPNDMSEADIKKPIMAVMAFILGLLTVNLTGIQLLSMVNTSFSGIGDTIVSGLVLGTGTEAVNTVVKFLGYVKDAQKPGPELEVVITPSVTSVKQGANCQFQAIIKNGSGSVQWRVLHSNGGTIDQNGNYTAPATTASQVFQIAAISILDTSKVGIVSVTVTP